MAPPCSKLLSSLDVACNWQENAHNDFKMRCFHKKHASMQWVNKVHKQGPRKEGGGGGGGGGGGL